MKWRIRSGVHEMLDAGAAARRFQDLGKLVADALGGNPV